MSLPRFPEEILLRLMTYETVVASDAKPKRKKEK